MSSHTPEFLALVEEAKKKIKEFSIDQVKEKMDGGKKFHLVDCREENEWDAGHIKNAIYIGKGIIERDIQKHIPEKNAEIIIYCRSGYRSVLAAEALHKMGYTNVSSMAGGIVAWADAQYPRVA